MTAAQFRKWRLSQELTQKQTGDVLGVPSNTVARWEQAARPVPHWVRLLIDARNAGVEARYTSGIAADYRQLRAGIAARRKAANAERYRRQWNLDKVVKRELEDLVEWIEEELDKLGAAYGLDAKKSYTAGIADRVPRKTERA
jgi:transcriptional regulator with XRE-family HTH domain